MKKVTIKDIAQIANVSRGTVDRVINGRGNVSEEISKRVEKIARDLGFEKNLVASALASNKKYRLAVVMPDANADIFWELPRRGILLALASIKHFGVTVDFYDFNLFDKDGFCLQMDNALASKPIAILTAPTFTKESIDYLDQGQALGIPFITFNTELDHPNVMTYVGQNSFQSGVLAARLLYLRMSGDDQLAAINLGHDINNALHYSDKVKGLRHFFQSKSLDPNKICFYEFSDFMDKEKTAHFWKTIIAERPNIKCLFFTNSRAYRLISVMNAYEIANIATVGFDMIEPNIALLQADQIDYLINQNPIQQGYLGMMSFVNHFVHRTPVKLKQYLPLDIVLKENIDFYLQNTHNLSEVFQ